MLFLYSSTRVAGVKALPLVIQWHFPFIFKVIG